MARFRRELLGIGGKERVYFYCPACLAHHRGKQAEYELVMGPLDENDLLIMALHVMNVTDVHRFDANYDRPTLEPSLMARTMRDVVCHSFIRGGLMEYLSDCTHEMAGQTVELPEIVDDPYRHRMMATMANRNPE